MKRAIFNTTLRATFSTRRMEGIWEQLSEERVEARTVTAFKKHRQVHEFRGIWE